MIRLKVALAAGKVRAVMAKPGATGGPGYLIRTPTASAVVRGTDFGLSVNAAAGKQWLCVLEGQVEFVKLSTGTALKVGAGGRGHAEDAVRRPAACQAPPLTHFV